jgi:hypothetical protein
MHRFVLVPPAEGHGAIDGRVLSRFWDHTGGWYTAFEIELRNPGGAPVDVDLAGARLVTVSMVDDSVATLVPVDGGDGPPPDQRREDRAAVGHVIVPVGETRAVWIAFGGKRDPRANLARRETLSIPGAAEIVLDERTAAKPDGVREYRGERRAVTIMARSAVDIGHLHSAFDVPYDLGAGLLFGDLRVDGHFGFHMIDDGDSGSIVRTEGFFAGPGLTWQASRYFGVYGDVDYTRLSTGSTGSTGSNAVQLDAGVALPLGKWKLGGGFNWEIPTAAFRVGWVETVASGSSTGALRIGLEISPARLW